MQNHKIFLAPIGTRFLFVIAFLFLQSCATRPYPICFFNEPPTLQEEENVRNELGKALGLYVPDSNNIVFASTARWVVVRTNYNGHKEIEKIWPKLGCIGRHRAESEEKYYRRCVQYVRDILDTKEYDIIPLPPNGTARPGYLYCDGKPE